MGMLDGLLGQITNNVDIANLAAKVGLDPAQVEQAVSAPAQAPPQPGNTAEQAEPTPGLSADTMRHIDDQNGCRAAPQRLPDTPSPQGDALGLGGLGARIFLR